MNLLDSNISGKLYLGKKSEKKKYKNVGWYCVGYNYRDDFIG